MKRFSHCFLRRAAVVGAFIGAAAMIHAGDVTAFRLAKGQVFTQTSASAPVANSDPFAILGSVEGNVSNIAAAAFQGAGFLSLSELNGRLQFADSGSSDLFNQFYPNGNYTLSVFTQAFQSYMATLAVNVTSYPTAIPHVSNFSAAQSVDPSAQFTVNFDPFTDAGANDYFEFEVTDDSGSGVFLQKGNGTTATIPAGKLQAGATYNAQLRFLHELSTDTTSIAGATGSTASYNETQFSIITSGSTGGTTGGTTAGTTGGTTAGGTGPTLTFVLPSTGSTGVIASSPMTFVFSTGMATTHSIQWSANVNSSALTYSWPEDTVLSVSAAGGFPANANVTWTLNPVPGGASNFRDSSGNELATISGNFSTGSGGTTGGSTGGTTGVTTGGATGGTTSGCQTPPSDTTKGFGVLMKELTFVQTGNTTPTPDTEIPAAFFATYGSASNQVVTKVTLAGPNGINKTLTNFFGSDFLTEEEFNSSAALEAAYPAGNYTLAATGAGSVTLPLGNTAAAVVPRFVNLVELTAADFSKAFTLQFSPYAGASGQFDSISINISDTQGGNFFAPDYCNNLLLPNTATSVVIPAGKLHTGSKLRGSITFYKSVAFNTNTIPNTFLSSALDTQTKFDFTSITPPPPAQPHWLSQYVFNPDGTITFTVQCDAGITLSIEGASALGTWSPLTTLSALSGSAQYTVNPKTAKIQLLRAKVL